MQLLGSSKKIIDKRENSKLVPALEAVEVVLLHCNLVNNSYQAASKVLFTLIPNKQFRQLITITPHSLAMLKTTNVEFSFIEIWFTDQNNRPLEIEDNMNITLIIGIFSIKMRYSLEPNYKRYAKGYGFLSFARKFGDKYGKKFMNTATKIGTGKYGKKIMDTIKN